MTCPATMLEMYPLRMMWPSDHDQLPGRAGLYSELYLLQARSYA